MIGYLDTSVYSYGVKLCKLSNQNLTVQTIESDERYSRLTAFNVLEGPTERLVASVFRDLRNSPLSSKAVATHLTTFRLCKITTADDMNKMAPSGPALFIVQWVSSVDIFDSKKRYSTALEVHRESSVRMRS